MSDHPAETNPAPDGNKRKSIVLIAVVAALLIAGGGAGAVFMLGSKAPKDDGKKGSPKKGKPGKKGDAAADEQAEGEEAGVKDPSKPPIFVVLETFTVNLQNPTGDQFLQIDVTLQVRDSKFAEMIKAYMPEVRSRVLLLLSGKKASDINNVAGKQQLAREISAETAKAIGDETAIKSAFFTSFVIQ